MFRETTPTTTPIALTMQAVNAVAERLLPSENDEWLELEAQGMIFAAAREARDAHPKWELFTIVVEGVTLQMRLKDRPSFRLVVTID